MVPWTEAFFAQKKCNIRGYANSANNSGLKHERGQFDQFDSDFKVDPTNLWAIWAIGGAIQTIGDYRPILEFVEVATVRDSCPDFKVVVRGPVNLKDI